jgi:peptidoglycan/LPS O-acetylase OafA/YrhL
MAQFSLGPGKWVCYAVSVTILGLLIWGPRPVILDPTAWSYGVQNLWGSTCRSIYVLMVFLVTLPGMSGSKDIVARFMSHDFFAWFARITFTGYLVHYIIIEASSYGFQDSTYIGFEEMNEYFAC